MKDQNLNVRVPEERDEDFLVEYGIIKRFSLYGFNRIYFVFRGPVIAKEELKEKVSSAPYFTQTPMTFYTEKMDDGCYYMSGQGVN